MTNSQPFINIPNYPVIEDVYAELGRLPRKLVLDAEALAKEAGAPRAANIVILGASAPFLGIAYEKLEDGIRRIFGKKGADVVAMNLHALQAGYNRAINNEQ